MFLLHGWLCTPRGISGTVCLCCVLVLAAHPASGQTPTACQSAVLTLTEAADLLRVDAAEVERLAAQGKLPGRRIGLSWRFGCAALMAWLNGDGEPPRDEYVAPLTDPSLAAAFEPLAPLVPSESAAVTGAGKAPGQDQRTPQIQSTPPPGQTTPVGEAPEQREAEDVFLRGQRVLLRRGQVVADVGLFFSRTAEHQLASLDGGIALTTAEHDVLTTLLLGRVGIFNETELFASTTFHSQDLRRLLGSAVIGSSGRSGFGATHVGIRRTLFRETARRPDIVISVNGQIRNRDTPAALGGGVVLVKSVDPVVLFTTANYLGVLDRHVSTVGRPHSTSRVDVSMGYGLALNDTLAISMAVTGVFTDSARIDRAALRQPGRFSARLGLTAWLAKGLYIEPSVSFGLNGPGDSFAFGLTMPYTF